MSHDRAKGSIEVRFSLLSLVCLMACWLGITLLAFFLGSMVGRMQQMNETKHRYAVPEHVVPEEDLPVLTFDDALSLPDITLNKPILSAEKRTGEKTSKERPAVAEVPKPKDIVDKPDIKVDKSTDIGGKPKDNIDIQKNKETRRVIQIASFQEKERAESLVEKLKKRGYSSFFSASKAEGSGKAYYRVLVGPFSSMENALIAKKKLEGRDKIKHTLIRQDTR